MKEKIDIKMELNKVDFLKLLSTYFTELLGKPVDLKVNATTFSEGYGRDEYTSVKSEFYFVNDIDLGIAKAKVTTTLSNEDIEEALNNILGKLNYSISSISYKTGIRSYGYMDDYEDPYFDGVTLYLNQKGIKKVLE